ncbi:hypothetical protein BGZ70_007720 [Mortierella alpina]|uniref:IPT/TIG domain-containing protein n=1 Tax=Mortierella alpina TaxID=64518 RepID=A0A9P6J575_MORAP|nr:hypothetical protein BGZ70_007720 [Mortierella alpina]
MGMQQQQQQQQSLDPVGNRMLHSHLSAPGKQRSPQHYGQRYNPMLAGATHPAASMSHNEEHTFTHIRLSESTSPMGISSSQEPHYNSSAASFSSDKVQHMYPQSLTPSPGLHPTMPNTGGVARPEDSLVHSGSASGRSNDLLIPSWTSTTVPSYVQNFEFTLRFTMLGYVWLRRRMWAALKDLGQLGDPRLPAFDVKAYTFRKKSRHYVAVKHKNALRIEPIIYLKTSIFDAQREVVRNWDYLRFSLGRFRENAIPKKKLSAEEMRSARILDVDISLTSPNNNDRSIEESCPACVMRMDGERRIMQVLAKNFKMTPMGEPVIDIRKGHAIVCIKLNCYCDHHNEQEGFVVRMKTIPEVVRMGGSVKLRICCEARSKSGPGDPDVEEEDGLTDIDAPVSTGSRSPQANERSVQSPSLSFGSESPDPRGHQRQRSSNSSSTASPRSLDERLINSLAVEHTTTGRNAMPPNFRKIYPLTPSEGTCLGGTRVTIHGAHFDALQNPIVFFGKVQAELVTVSHHDVMECTTPPAEGLKPGIVPVRIASLVHPLSAETDSVDFMYMAPPDYDFYNLAATSLSYAMANEYPNADSLSFILNAHGSAASMGLGQGLLDGSTAIGGSTVDMGYAWSAKEDLVLDFLRVIQIVSPGRILPAFKSVSGHTLLHMAVQYGMERLVKELLAMGIDHAAVDMNRKNALQFAQLMSNDVMIELISKAKLPPRPMVPRLDPHAANSSVKETIASLIQKHEAVLRKVLEQEQERKQKELHGLHERSLRVMEQRDRSTENAAGPTTSDDDILEHVSEESSPSSRTSEDSSIEEFPIHAVDRKRKSEMESLECLNSTKRLLLGAEHITKAESGRVLDPSQHSYIQSGCTRWEQSKGQELFGSVSAQLQSQELRVWVCESTNVVSLKDSDDADMTFELSSGPTLTALALSATGLHLYTEQPKAQGPMTRGLKHWSLVEIEKQELLSDALDIVRIDVCGLVPRGGRDLSGERIIVNSAFAPEIDSAILSAKTRLDQQLRLPTVRVHENWMGLRLRMWSKLFGAEERELDAVLADHMEVKDDTLFLKPSLDDRGGRSVGMMGAILCTVRETESLKHLRFAGAMVAEEGWSKPELVKELEKTVQARMDVTTWDFADCGWTTATLDGFVSGFREGPQEQQRQCKEISLAGNKFEGGEQVGHLLSGCFKNMLALSTFDLTGCGIELEGMEILVQHINGLAKLCLQGNRADQRWWQWMDTVLSQNPLLKSFSLGAPVASPEPQDSLVKLGRLESLTSLIDVDFSTAPMTQSSLDVLDQYLRSAPRHLRTLKLSRCELNWSDLVPVFKTICQVNTSTKFTLDVSQNPLFATERAVEDWALCVREAHVDVPFGIQATDMLIEDKALQQVLEPMENATCFNELNIKGLYIASRPPGLEADSFDEARLRTVPENASERSCRALGRILASNSTLLMLDVSGTVVEPPVIKDVNHLGSETAVRPGRAVGGFGGQLALALPELAQNSTLRILAIDNNGVGEDGMIEFFKAMRFNRGVRVLSCDGNDAFTPKGLETIEEIFAPLSKSAALSDCSLQEQGYNTTLSVWRFGRDEIMTHIQLMTLEVLRLKAEFNRVEKLQDRSNKEQTMDLKFLGSTPLADTRRRWEAAERRRDEYSLRHERIMDAVEANNNRSKALQPTS